MMQVQATATATRVSTYVSDGVDVEVRVLFPDGGEVSGEVTLVRSQDRREGSSRWVAWGSPDNWIESTLLRALENRFDDRDDFKTALGEIEQAAAYKARELA